MCRSSTLTLLQGMELCPRYLNVLVELVYRGVKLAVLGCEFDHLVRSLLGLCFELLHLLRTLCRVLFDLVEACTQLP